jgi:hypothetical protein
MKKNLYTVILLLFTAITFCRNEANKPDGHIIADSSGTPAAVFMYCKYLSKKSVNADK